MTTRTRHLLAGAVAIAALMAGPAFAAELPPGTMITKENLDKVKTDTFEGKTIASMLPAVVEMQVRDWGLRIKLRKSEPVPPDERYMEATRKYSGDVKFDPQTRNVSGYKAGFAFPVIDPKDPHAGDKVMWNYHVGAPLGQAGSVRGMTFLLVDGNKGIEQTQKWEWRRYFHVGHMDGTPTEGDGEVFSRTLMFASYPQDIRGLGTFTIRYMDADRVDDMWAYTKQTRRVRRVSGGGWMDPIGGTDMLQDDQDIWDAPPSWYKQVRLIEKRWILAVAHGLFPIDKAKMGSGEEFLHRDLKNPPYWNPLMEWEPREVWVVEGITPDEHPYSKKIVYVDAEANRVLLGEAYDRKGDFWKFFNWHNTRFVGDDNFRTMIPNSGEVIDFKRRHATAWVGDSTVNDKSLTSENVTLERLRQGTAP